jgi:hypothetical protein
MTGCAGMTKEESAFVCGSGEAAGMKGGGYAAGFEE